MSKRHRKLAPRVRIARAATGAKAAGWGEEVPAFVVRHGMAIHCGPEGGWGVKWVHWPARHGPGEYRLNLGPLELVVHRHIDDPGRWHISCHRIQVQRVPLQSTAAGDACEEAHRYCIARVQAMHTALGQWDPARLADEVRAVYQETP